MKTPFSGISNKRIPTIVGLVILVVALVLGTVFFQQGLGVFAPRATAETTPKQVRVTNIVDSGFTISFLTEGDVAGFIRYGTEENALRQNATDDRDTLTGSIGEYTLHHITVRGLQPNTTYYYVLGTGSNTLFDNNGVPFKIVTARKSGSPAAARTIFGSVTTESGAPAEGAVVYVAVEGAGEMSSLVKNSGSWAVPLSNARTPDGSAYAAITDDTSLQLFIQGPSASQTARGAVTAGEYKSQPIPTISYGQTAIEATAASQTSVTNDEEVETTETAQIDSTEVTQVTDTEASSSSDFSSTEATDSGELLVLDLTEAAAAPEPLKLIDSPDVIRGKAPPNVQITIEVNSETQITQQLVANADGTFSLDLTELKKTLEPGEHTVTYSYVDPNSGETVPETITFYVEPQNATANLLAQANPTPSATASPTATPFGSSNPFPISSATTSAQSSSSSASSTDSGRTSQPSTSSGMPVSGSIGTTMALIFGGLFFIISGLWSFWVSKNYATEETE